MALISRIINGTRWDDSPGGKNLRRSMIWNAAQRATQAAGDATRIEGDSW